MLKDNGDIVHAVGYVAIYGAYLEDRIAELIDMTNDVIPLRKNINCLPTSDQVKDLLKAFNKAFASVPSYNSKDKDIKITTEILNAVEGHLKYRNVIIHSILISNGDVTIQKNRRINIEEEVGSKEIIDLANDLFKLQKQLSGLKFPVKRLIDALSS